MKITIKDTVHPKEWLNELAILLHTEAKEVDWEIAIRLAEYFGATTNFPPFYFRRFPKYFRLQFRPMPKHFFKLSTSFTCGRDLLSPGFTCEHSKEKTSEEKAYDDEESARTLGEIIGKKIYTHCTANAANVKKSKDLSSTLFNIVLDEIILDEIIALWQNILFWTS